MGEKHLMQKKQHLLSIISGYDSLMVAFSGGVDSTFLLAVAYEALKKKVVAITAKSPVHPARENRAAAAFAKRLGIEHIIIASKEMNQPRFRANTKDRCYLCKQYVFEDILKIARARGIEYVAHGANIDDLKDFRPGFAAAQEMGVQAPLVDARLTKEEIRLLSKKMNLPTWNKPPMACLATRIPYGTPIKIDDLKMLEQAEDMLLQLGFDLCRVRLHGKVARIEVDPKEFTKMLDQEVRRRIVEKFRAIGFFHVALDLEGYQQGSMNRSL